MVIGVAPPGHGAALLADLHAGQLQLCRADALSAAQRAAAGHEATLAAARAEESRSDAKQKMQVAEAYMKGGAAMAKAVASILGVPYEGPVEDEGGKDIA